ncbi:ATP-binding protein [Pelagicoccus sp. SDUM812003]|uniref:ATP-binding protein n=1 Tax=Pelagicoccus sp. SDUM812003 TaxID=3041267 RepID=UPI0028105080|nr:ATP-binding protein [Pelagicoccus sp. SDUM812003]MDQ8201953.1 ATP-binding protein [Pelagicoccus sp. SDUM812003]
MPTSTQSSPSVRRCLALLASACIAFFASAQAERDSFLGSPYFSVYEPTSIGSQHGLNHISIDPFGRILVASGANVLAFDGNVWLTYTPKELSVSQESFSIHTIGLAPNGKLYASTTTGIHQLSFAAGKRYELRSIADVEQHHHQGVSTLLELVTDGDIFYFYGQGSIAELDTATESVRFVQETSSSIASAALHQNSLYAFGVDGKALKREGNQWRALGSGEILRYREGIRSAESWPGVGLLLGPDISGLQRLDEEAGIVPWPSEIDQLETHRILDMEPISDQVLALSVANNGIFLINRKGEVIQCLSRSIDYRFGQANHLIHAGNGVVWAISESSVIRVDFLKPLTDISKLLPYATTYPRIFWHRDRMHVVSDSKLVGAITSQGGALLGFERLASELPSRILNAISVEDGILCATVDGVFLLRDDQRAQQIAGVAESTLVVRHPDYPNQAVAIGGQEYRLLKREDGQWRATSFSRPSRGLSYDAVLDKDGVIWLELGVGAVARLEMRPDSFDVRRLGAAEGLANYWVNIWQLGERTLFGVGSDMEYQVWDANTQAFTPVKEKIASGIFRDYPGVTRPVLDSESRLWVPTNSNHVILRMEEDGSISRDTETLASIQNERLLWVRARGEGIWLTGKNKIFHFNTAYEKPLPNLPETSIVSIEDPNTDTLLFDGLSDQLSDERAIAYRNNSLLIHAATPTIAYPHDISHQYRILGKSRYWHRFSTPESLALTNLLEGDYRIQIRAVSNNTYGAPTEFSFTIFPPFYRSAYAYFLYLLTFGILLYIGVRFIRTRAERRNKLLQSVVDLRTRELRVANDELKTLVRKAESATIAKTAFLHNVSHEMRTPLNGIIGPSTLLLRSAKDADSRTLAKLAKESGERLAGIIEKLLLFAEAEGNDLNSDVSSFHIQETLSELLSEFEEIAQQKQLELQLRIEPSTPRYWFGQSAKVRQALRILLENALKFTESGCVNLSAQRITNIKEGEFLVIEVSDTGIGIKKELLKSLFEPFQQGRDKGGNKHSGTGIGLAICQQLVLSMNGQIEVESEEENGALFRITLPQNVLSKNKRQSAI